MRTSQISVGFGDDCLKLKASDGRILGINAAAARAVGRIPEDLLGANTRDFWHFASAYAEDDRRVLDTRQPLHRIEKTTYQDRIVWAEVWKSPIHCFEAEPRIFVRWRFCPHGDFAGRPKRKWKSYGYSVALVNRDPEWLPQGDIDVPPAWEKLLVISEHLEIDEARSIVKFMNAPSSRPNMELQWALILPPGFPSRLIDGKQIFNYPA